MEWELLSNSPSVAKARLQNIRSPRALSPHRKQVERAAIASIGEGDFLYSKEPCDFPLPTYVVSGTRRRLFLSFYKSYETLRSTFSHEVYTVSRTMNLEKSPLIEADEYCQEDSTTYSYLILHNRQFTSSPIALLYERRVKSFEVGLLNRQPTGLIANTLNLPSSLSAGFDDQMNYREEEKQCELRCFLFGKCGVGITV